jgi:hypothetical protein
MKTDSILYWVIYFVVTVLVAWIALSLILLWFRPALYNADGSVNWWVTLWVAALIILFAWIIMIILWFIFSLFRNGFGGCAKPNECEKPKDCDPCKDKVVVPGVGGSPAPYDPRIWMY